MAAPAARRCICGIPVVGLLVTHIPRILITSGEPAGVGPDLCIAIAQRKWPCELVFAGDRDVFAARALQLGQPFASAHVLHVPAAATVIAGQLDSRNARSVLTMLDAAAAGCLRGEFAAVVTAPVQKSIINDAGIAFSGHTEYFAEKTGAPTPVMMLVAGSLRVALATTHLPISAVSSAITPQSLEQVITVLDRDLRARFGIPKPRILVCGLNPHAGEGGHLGAEEIEVIAPTLSVLRARGVQLVGPAPADTAFTPRMLAQADAVLA
ncbi:MAG: 4-hydroxythreonine-4-phosphate dehydrogenase PdxA, partial [Candidatus Obscuribacterales bacterium]|nr:4-hydroxythreonine-4-phosphate dehydrogenase PdxA [Steroidobacteraceae bacterium]